MCQISDDMDSIQIIQQPITKELRDFAERFTGAMSHDDGLLGSVLKHVRERGGKRMRPMLTLLIAKNFGGVTEGTLHAAVSLELLHTASLVHDDVVDESNKRRGQASVNALFDNKVAVLVGDYILSTALQIGANSGHNGIVRHLAELGKTLSDGEILQLTNDGNECLSEEKYFEIIEKKTAILFEKCAILAAETSEATPEQVEAARQFGYNIGVIFQIRDDIFDYFDSKEIGKPTGNDMLEGKLTLPAIYALNATQNTEAMGLAVKVKEGTATTAEIGDLIEFTKQCGGVEYAEKVMHEYYAKAKQFVDNMVADKEISRSLMAYLDFMIERKY